MDWLQKLFGKGGAPRPSVDYGKVIRDYGAVLEATAGESVSNQNRLPIPKDKLRPILLAAIASSPVGTMREQLKTAYVSMGQFVEMTDSEQAAVKGWDFALKGSGSSDGESLVNAIADNGEVCTRLMDLSQKQMSALMNELRKLGL